MRSWIYHHRCSEILLENSGLAINFKLSQYSIKVVLGIFLQTPISQEASLPSTSHTSATHTRSSALVVSLTFILRTDDPCVTPPKISEKRNQQVLQKMDIEPFQRALLLLAPAKPYGIKNGMRLGLLMFQTYYLQLHFVSWLWYEPMQCVITYWYFLLANVNLCNVHLGLILLVSFRNLRDMKTWLKTCPQ